MTTNWNADDIEDFDENADNLDSGLFDDIDDAIDLMDD